jgi:hypothetical protein
MLKARITTVLSTNSKRYWPRFPIIVQTHTLTNFPHAKKEAKSLKESLFSMEKPSKYDPKGIIESHMKSIGLVHSIQHEEKP